MNSDCTKVVKNAIERYQMLSPGDLVIIGLSGGADSVALLSFLNDLKDELNLTLVAAHVNHGLRGDESDRDEAFARSLCTSFDIEFCATHPDIYELAEEMGQSIETCAREFRYDFFTTVASVMAQRHSITDYSKIKVATAHNACDVAETMLLNLNRGSGLSGLLSIPPVREHEGTGIKIIRPIINLERSQIEEYLKEKELSFVTDSTNFVDDCSRNIIRLNVLPELQRINKNSISCINRCIDTLREDEEFLDRLATEAVESATLDENSDSSMSACYNLTVISGLEKPVLKRALSKMIESFCGMKPEKVHIALLVGLIASNLEGEGIHRVQITDGIFAETVCGDGHNLLKFYREVEKAEVEDFYFEVPAFSKQISISAPNCEIRVNILEKDELDENICFEKLLDYGTMNGNFILRNRREGDKFYLPHRKVTKSLKNLFNEMKIPADKRQELIILEVSGEIAYIQGVGPSGKHMATEDTEIFLEIEFIGG